MTGNRLLDRLAPTDLKRILPRLRKTTLRAKDQLSDGRSRLKDVCFPRDAILSLLVHLKDGTEVEVANVGYEGMLSPAAYLDDEGVLLRAVCQVEGEAWLWDARDFLKEVGRNPRLEALLKRYVHYLLGAYSQSVACNRANRLEQRCARWLLLGYDRAQRDEFPLTHEFIAKMLGVRRATVTEVASRLQKRGLITYRWGKIRIVDRAGLEGVSCECYRADHELYRRCLGRE